MYFLKLGGVGTVCRWLTGGPTRNGKGGSTLPPLLSIGLAIFEDVVDALDEHVKKQALEEVYQGGVIAVLIGSLMDEQHQGKALFLLSELGTLEVVAEVLPVLLDTHHYQVLCCAAIEPTPERAIDQTSKWACKILTLLIDCKQQQSGLSVLRHLVLGRCVGALLKVGDTSLPLIQKASSSQGT
eukprot:TRINITY_DN57847_c0_g1_i3.p1 TRINITY_DN57847_c0_g1~~TRINITY_DN57847_c0_g1_i3.p1  ORF type:complete len:184 (-),score=29.57 TRINITY_DN57847_c0_g1_i3:62-613(-)